MVKEKSMRAAWIFLFLKKVYIGCSDEDRRT